MFIEVYLSIGILIAIVQLFILFSDDFDEYYNKHFSGGHPITTTNKITSTLSTVFFWPVYIFILLTVKRGE